LKQLTLDSDRLRRVIQQIMDDNFGLEVEVSGPVEKEGV
jgi:hypothetical protein